MKLTETSPHDWVRDLSRTCGPFQHCKRCGVKSSFNPWKGFAVYTTPEGFQMTGEPQCHREKAKK